LKIAWKLRFLFLRTKHGENFPADISD